MAHISSSINVDLIRGIRDEPYELKGFRIRLMEPADFQLSADIAAQSEAVRATHARTHAAPHRHATNAISLVHA